MKISKFLLGILMISFIICKDKRIKFANNIENYVKNTTKPHEEEEESVSDYKNISLFFYILTLKELNEVQKKFGLSDFLTNQLKEAPYTRSKGAIKVQEKIQYNFYSYEKTIGSPIKEEDNKISSALIKTQSIAKLCTRYEKYYTRESEHS